MLLPVPPNLQDLMPAGSLSAIRHAVVADPVDETFRRNLTDYLALCVIGDDKLKGKFLTSVYAQDPGLFSRLGEYGQKHDALIARLRGGPAPRP